MGDPEVKVAHVTVIRRKPFKATEAHSVASVLKETEISWALKRGYSSPNHSAHVQRPGLTNPLCFLVEKNGPVRGTDQVGQ